MGLSGTIFLLVFRLICVYVFFIPKHNACYPYFIISYTAIPKNIKGYYKLRRPFPFSYKSEGKRSLSSISRNQFCWLQESKQTAHYTSENTQALLSTSGLAALLSRMSGAAVRCCPSIHFNPRATRDKPLVERAQLFPLPLS